MIISVLEGRKADSLEISRQKTIIERLQRFDFA
jgi:hypothetical protein